jgi:hypothetical protein
MGVFEIVDLIKMVLGAVGGRKATRWANRLDRAGMDYERLRDIRKKWLDAEANGTGLEAITKEDVAWLKDARIALRIRVR